MLLDSIPWETIQEEHLRALIDIGQAESQRIDYKSDLPSKESQSRLQFLRNVASFANSVGGYLVFGMTEEGGVPNDVKGITISNKDGQSTNAPNVEGVIQQLEGIIRSGIRPRIRVQSREIRLADGKFAFLIKIPRSRNRPHQIVLQEPYEFVTRHSNGKAQMTIDEIQNQILFGNTAIERVEAFHQQQIEHIQAGKLPVVNLISGARLVLHLIPLENLVGRQRFSLNDMQVKQDLLAPAFTVGSRFRLNLQGLIAWTESSSPFGEAQRYQPSAYCQAFRFGGIEFVDAYALNRNKQEIRQDAIEAKLLEALPRYLQFQHQIGAELPIVLMLTYIGIKGCILKDKSLDEDFPLQEEVLDIPEVIIESYDTPPVQILQPIFDMVWNAAGRLQSPYIEDK